MSSIKEGGGQDVEEDKDGQRERDSVPCPSCANWDEFILCAPIGDYYLTEEDVCNPLFS